MKMITRFSAGIVLLFVALTAYFWTDIQDIRALMAYSALFEREHIDENFRSMHHKFSSVTVSKSGPTATFEPAPVQDIFPDTYRLKGENMPFEPLWEAFHYTGLVILRDGKLLHESYARGNTAEDLHIEMSVTKSLTSIIFGALVDQGFFPDLNAMVTNFIPELSGSGYENVTLQQVLDMTSGIRYLEEYDDLNSEIVQTVVASLRGSLDDYSMTIEGQRPPGSVNHYASIETQVLAWVMRRATGKSYPSLFEEHLWSKIGAEADAEILVDAAGNAIAFGGANLRLRDLARVGQMMLNDGVSMTGERVVSSEWITQSTTTDTPQSQPGYDNALSDYPLGYKNQWWIPNDREGREFLAIGIYGQFLYINPEARIVIAMNSAYPDYNDKDNLELDMVAGLQAIARFLKTHQ